MICEYKSLFGMLTGWLHHNACLVQPKNCLSAGWNPVAQQFFPKILFFLQLSAIFYSSTKLFLGCFQFSCQQVHSINSKPTDHVNHTVEYYGSFLIEALAQGLDFYFIKKSRWKIVPVCFFFEKNTTFKMGKQDMTNQTNKQNI